MCFKHKIKEINLPDEVFTNVKPVFLGDKNIKQPKHISTTINSIHEDSYCTDTTEYCGLTEKNLEINYFNTNALIGGICSNFTFTSKGYLVTLSISFARSLLMLIDPITLMVLDQIKIPHQTPSILKFLIPKERDKMFREVSGGAYFYLDEFDRVVLAGSDNNILIIATEDSNGQPKLIREGIIKIKDPRVSKSKDKIIAVMPAWTQGHESRKYWFVTKFGLVGLVELTADHKEHEYDKHGQLIYPTLEYISKVQEYGHHETFKHNPISNSFPVNKNGIFIVSCRAIYRFSFDGLNIKCKDRFEYALESCKDKKILPGRLGVGSGTTPTLMDNRYVTFGDDSVPMNIFVCDQQDLSYNSKISAFPNKDASACELSFIVKNNSIIATNTYGYKNPFSWNGHKPNGISKVNVKELPLSLELDKMWITNPNNVDAGSSTAKLSLMNGIIYVYSMEHIDPKTNDGNKVQWNLMGIEYLTGNIVYKVPIFKAKKYKRQHDNSWGIITIAPNGDLFLAMWNGFIVISAKR